MITREFNEAEDRTKSFDPNVLIKKITEILTKRDAFYKELHKAYEKADE